MAADAAGNGNAAANQFSIEYDISQPSVLLASTETSPTNASPIPVTITFEEPVTGFTQGDLVITNGSPSNFSGSDASYTATITPAGDGIITVDIPANVAINGAGNGNAAAPQFSIEFDGTGPGVLLASTESSPTNSSPIPVTITFDEPISDLLVSDLVVGNGSAGNLSGTGADYTVDITPGGSGTVTVDLPADVVADAAGNGNIAAVQFSILSDTSLPTAQISSLASSPTNTSPIPVIITFDEPISGLLASDLVVGNGSAGNLSGSGADYTVDITPGSSGTVTVDLPADVAADAAGNGNAAANQFSIEYDSSQPSVLIASSETSPTNASPIPVTITFEEPVTGFTQGDLVISNGSPSNFSGSDASYTATITPAGDGMITVDIPANVAINGAGNGNAAAPQFSIEFDGTGPGVLLASTESSPTNSSPIPVTITFDEPISDLLISDLVVGNGSAGNLSGTGADYTVDITPGGSGTVTVDLPADVVADAAGNGNIAAVQFSVLSDTSPPTAQISSLAGSPTNTSPIPVIITFDEPVSGLLASDLVVGNGSAGNLSGSGADYTVDITPGGSGTVTVDLPADVAADAAGNGNAAAIQFSIEYDISQPSVLLASTETSPTNASPIPVTITFEEPVTGFTQGDLVITNGSPSNFSGSDASYTANITPAGDGIITVDIPANVAIDGAGNGNAAAPQFSIEFDGTGPGVLLASTESSPTNSSPIPVTITFDETVNGFTLSDLDVTNGSAGNFSGNGANYSAYITPLTDGAVTVNVDAGSAMDIAGNENSAAPQFSIVYQETDSEAPDPVDDLAALNITDTAADLIWSEPYDNVGVTDYEVIRDGSSLGFTGGARAYHITGLDPETSYIFTVYAQDAEGNVSDISNIVTINTTEVHYTTANANLTTVDWRTRDLLVNGNLGIGTTNTSGYLLAVAGGVIAESVKVDLQSDWPDFVFSQSYPLPTLAEVKRHIEGKGHLMGIPSASEVREEGIDLGDMNARLLQKIEELTLYMLQQEKRIQDLEEEMRKQQETREKVKATEKSQE